MMQQVSPNINHMNGTDTALLLSFGEIKKAVAARALSYER